MNEIIEIKHLYKSFKDVKAVQNLSFEVKQGELFAFLGLNGAGKSTTISIICGELEKDSGTVIIDGVDVESNLAEVKKKLGVVFQFSVLDKVLSVADNLKTRACLYGLTGKNFDKKIEELDKLLNIKPLFKRTFGKLSGGEKRRIDIARALLNDPKILILDEPTTGLDPQTRKLVWTVLERLRKEKQMTIFLTTHYMEEASGADYVVILDNGKISAEGTPFELKTKYTGDFITLYNPNKEDVEKLGVKFKQSKNVYRFEVENTKVATELILKHPGIFIDYEITKGNMDDVFLAVTGKKLGGGNNVEFN